MSTSAAPVVGNSAAVNLRRLLLVRLVAAFGQAAVIWFAVQSLHMVLPLRPLVFIWAGVALFSLLSAWRLRWRRAVGDAELLLQLAVDVAALTGFFYYTGGAGNPFVPLYLLPLAFAAAALPTAHAWALAGLTTFCYTLLLFHFVPLPGSHAGDAHDFSLHVIGMWIGFVIAAVLIAGFGARIDATRRAHERLAAETRERQLREEQVIALGTLAAGTAHELGTPLSTMAVVIKDLAPGTPVPAAKLETLRMQIARCKEILGALTASAGAMRAEGGEARALDEWLTDILEKWRASRPGLRVRAHLAGAPPAPRIYTERTVAQAIDNILDNAADASPEALEIEGRWNANELVLEVADRGPGLAPDVAENAGKPFFSTKASRGMGLGLFLAREAIERLGGSVTLANRDGGGALCRVRLPLAMLKVAHA